MATKSKEVSYSDDRAARSLARPYGHRHGLTNEQRVAKKMNELARLSCIKFQRVRLERVAHGRPAFLGVFHAHVG